MDQNINSWVINYSVNKAKIIETICDHSNKKTYLLDLNKQTGTLIEKTIIDIAMFHLNRLNIHNAKDYYIEFSCKSNFDKLVDCDFHQYTKYTENGETRSYPLLSSITYFNDAYNCPNILTNIDYESYKYKLFAEQKQILLSLPKTNYQISFEGNLYTCATTLNEEDIYNKYIISVNIWNIKPNNIDYYKPVNNNESFEMYNNTIISTNNVDIPSINVSDDIINYKLFNDLLYMNNHTSGYIFDNIIKQYYKDNNDDINTIKLVLDKSIKEKETEIILKNKYGDIIDDLKSISDNKISVTHNRFLQRFTYTKIFNYDMCKYIIDESNKYANINGGWNTKRHQNYPTTDLSVENISSIFILIMHYLNNTIIDLIKTSYQIHDNLDINIDDLFIVRYSSDKQNSLDMHKDNSHITFNILLSDNADFEGGGTYFEDGLTTKLECGDMLIHTGRINHRGLPITKGDRYLLVGFINISE